MVHLSGLTNQVPPTVLIVMCLLLRLQLPYWLLWYDREKEGNREREREREKEGKRERKKEREKERKREGEKEREKKKLERIKLKEKGEAKQSERETQAFFIFQLLLGLEHHRRHSLFRPYRSFFLPDQFLSHGGHDYYPFYAQRHSPSLSLDALDGANIGHILQR